MLKVKIKKLVPEAVVPAKKYQSDFCYDLVAVSEEEIAPNVWKYGFGFALQLEDSKAKSPNTRFSFDIRPRSSVWKTGMVLSNCEGTVDEHYRGEVSVVFYHVMPSMERYKVGDRVAQMKLGSTVNLEFEVMDDLDVSDRGENGFGSTGR